MKKLHVTLLNGDAISFDGATFFDRFRPGVDSVRLTLGADAITGVELVDVDAPGIAAGDGDAAPSEAQPAQDAAPPPVPEPEA